MTWTGLNYSDGRGGRQMKAKDFLDKAISVLAERGSKYESNGEENSMAEIVELQANLIGDRDAAFESMTELEGWFFMLALKLVRLRKSIEQGKASKDSIVDLLGYTAKMGECLFADEPTEPFRGAIVGSDEHGNVLYTEVPDYGSQGECAEDKPVSIFDMPLWVGGPTNCELQVEANRQISNRQIHDGLAKFSQSPLLAEQDCHHFSCTLKDIEDRLVIVCDDCPKQFTAKEFVDNECEAR